MNWACATRETWDVTLGVHNQQIELAGTSAVRLDLDNAEEFRRQIAFLSPDLIVHAAGLTSVDHCEQDPELAHQSNVVIAKNVAVAAAASNVPLIHISTDHLFSGSDAFYLEDDELSPLNEYGRSKALAEYWVGAVNPDALIIRTNFFGWGHRKRQSFSDWLLSGLREKKPLSLFNDVFYTPILADVLAKIVHRLVLKRASGIFNVVGDQRLSKYEFGLLLAACFGEPPNFLLADNVANARLAAERPKDMSLDNSKTSLMLGEALGSVPAFLEELRKQEAEGRAEELFSAIADGGATTEP